MKSLFILILFFLSFPLLALAETDYLQQGAGYLAGGNYKNAIRSYEKAIQAKQDSAAAYKGIGLAYFKLGVNEHSTNIELAEKSQAAFKASVAIKPDAESYYHLGIIALNFDEKNNAIDVHKILKDIDSKKGEELAAKIVAYVPPTKSTITNIKITVGGTGFNAGSPEEAAWGKQQNARQKRQSEADQAQANWYGQQTYLERRIRDATSTKADLVNIWILSL